MNNMGNLFDEVESELIKQFRAMTPEQLAEEERRRQVKREYEALHTPIETDEDRANKDENPDEGDE
jgi:hypothetical protein